MKDKEKERVLLAQVEVLNVLPSMQDSHFLCLFAKFKSFYFYLGFVKSYKIAMKEKENKKPIIG